MTPTMERLREQADQIISDVAKLASVRLQESGEAGGYVRRFGGAHRPTAASTPAKTASTPTKSREEERALLHRQAIDALNNARLTPAGREHWKAVRDSTAPPSGPRQDNLSKFGL
jgi:hypothetical protein